LTGRTRVPLTIGIDGRELQGRPTGTGRYLRSLLRIWSSTSEDRLVAYFNGPPPQDAALRHPRIRARALGARPTRGLVWQEIVLPAAARQDGLDVFFAPAFTCSLRLGVPRVTAVHDLSFFSIPEDFAPLDAARRRALVGASLRASRAVLVCSDFTRREIAARYPELAPRLVHVPLGADDDLAPPPSREQARARLGQRGPLLLSVGTILNRRCLPVLLRAASHLARRRPDLVLDVVGENRTHPRADLRATVRSLGLEREVRLSGFVGERALAERYAAADVAVCLSEYEGFGLPALEAMARGVPVVLSSRPALGEIFGEAAVLVDPRDAAAVAGAIDAVLGRPELRADLVARGRELASRFRWSETAARTREALHAAAGA
jgi:glycosyltransferase involved in cell wall biosynthesis